MLFGGAVRRPARLLAAVADFVERWPERAFWGFLALHVTGWTLLLIAVRANPSLDMIEGAVFGQHWQVLYWKHPPLPWLIVDTLRRAFGPQLWPLLLVPQLVSGLTLWAVWRLARELLPPLPALVSVLLLEGCRTFSYGSESLNHDTASLPWWALAAWFFWRAVRDGHRRDWLLTGLWFGVAFYAKHSVSLLLLACALFLVVEGTARRRLSSAGPWLAAGVLLLVISPQLWALATHPVQPFAFARSHATSITAAWHLLWRPTEFLLVQLLHLAPLLAMVALIRGRRPRADPAAPRHLGRLARRYVATIAFGPTLLAVIAATAAGYGLRWSWGVSFWSFAGLAAVALLDLEIDRQGLLRLLRVLPLVAAGSAAVVVAGEMGVSPPRGGVPRGQFAGAELARQVAARWNQHVDGPLPFVVGPRWVAGNVSFHLPDRPYVFVNADQTRTPWIDPEAVRASGGAIVWPIADGRGPVLPERYSRVFPEAQPVSPVRLTMSTMAGMAEQWFGVALVLPDDAAQFRLRRTSSSGADHG